MNSAFLYNLFVVLSNTALFDEEYTVGQAGLITWLRDNAGVIICYVISAVGFLIVAAAIIKNALAGLYLAFPRMWDKVSEVRKNVESGFENMAGGEKGKKAVGTFAVLLLSMLPDVKSATEFGEGGDSEMSSGEGKKFMKKQWISKAIPEFIALCMIGMLIFYGYPTKLANWIGNTGRFALDAFFDNVDPVQLTKKVFTGISTYELATDSATNSLEKNVNALTRSAVKQMYTKYSDMQSQPLQETALSVETLILNVANDCTGLNAILSEQDGLTVSFMSQLTATKPVMGQAFKEATDADGRTIDGLYFAESTSGVKQYKFRYSTANLPTGSTKVGENDWILVTVNATPKSQSVVNSAVIAFVQGCKETAGLDKPNVNMSATPAYLTLPGLVPNSTSDFGIYATEGASIKVNVLNADGAVIFTTNGAITNMGSNLAVTFTSTAATKLNSAINSGVDGSAASYVEVMLPDGTYTTYTNTTNGVEILTKVSVNIYKFSFEHNKDASGWINRNWNDYKDKNVVPQKELDANFFEMESSQK